MMPDVLFEAWKEYCESSGMRPGTKNELFPRLLRVDVRSLRRRLYNRRKDLDVFPMPVSGEGWESRWSKSDVEDYEKGDGDCNETNTISRKIRIQTCNRTVERLPQIDKKQKCV